MHLLEEIQVITKQLDSALLDLRQHGTEFAEAERSYREMKSKKILELKDKGNPATLIPDIVKGDEEVSELLFKRNASEVIYKANQEAINIKKLEYRLLTAMYEREYDNTK